MSKRRQYQDVSELTPLESSLAEKSSPDTGKQNSSPPVNLVPIVLLPLKILGSLTVGIIISVILLTLLAWGTFIESEYGAAIARFTLYGSPWFALLLGLFGLNILCSMLIRFPWKLHHAPFLMAHCGILVLFFGCYLTWRGGEIAQITLPEGAAGTKAVKPDQQHFTVQTISYSGTTHGAINIPFEPGPFNWEDYNRANWKQQNRPYRTPLGFLANRTLLGLAMQWGHRNLGQLRGSLKDVKIEVLDYLVNSATEPAPPLELSFLWKKTVPMTTEWGEIKETPRNWERVQLDIKQPQGHFGSMEIRGVQTELMSGERVNFRTSICMAEIEAFQNAKPDWNANIGTYGQVILYYSGKNYFLDVNQLIQNTEGDKRFPLKGTPFEIGTVQFNRRGPLISLTLYTPDNSERLMLFPDNPEMNVQAQLLGVFGSYWLQSDKLVQNIDYADHPVLKRLALPRLDFIQGTDKKLYYRFWDGQNIVASDVIPDRTSGKKTQLTVAAQTPEEVEIVVERFVPQDLPGLRIVSVPAGKNANTEQRVQLRVTVDGKEDTFWLRAVEKSVVPLPPERDQVRYIHGNGRSVQIQWNYDTVDLGFGIFLKKFEMRTEPGTRMSSHYSSLVDFVEMRTDLSSGFSRSQNDFRVIEDGGQDVLISMNRPTVFRGTGRSFRIYQSSYNGPYFPDNPWFYDLYDSKIFPWEKKPRESVYMSTLSINDDPGRGLKYLGCFLLVFGTIWLIQRAAKRTK